MPTHHPTPKLATLAALLLAAPCVASDSLTPDRFAQIRPGAASSHGPAGMRPRVDPAVTPATFHAHAAKPLAPPTVEQIAAESAANPVPTRPPTLEPSAPIDRLQADAAPRIAPQPPAEAAPSGRRLVASDASERLVDRRRQAAPSFSNPLDSLTNWRPSTQQLAATIGAGGVVIGLVISFVWLLRCCTPKSARPLPREVVEVLGRASLGGKQTTQLVRVGPKLVLLAATPDGLETLTEITDPSEVARILAACERGRGAGTEAEFDSLLQEMSLERGAGGFLGGYSDDSTHDDYRNGPPGFAQGAFDPRSLAAAYANTPGGRGDG